MKQFYPFLLLCMLYLSSCIGDNMDSCPPGEVSLTFTYTHHQGSGDLFTSQVDTLDVYLYDESDTFINRYHIAQNKLQGGTTLRLPGIADGQYTAIVWGMNQKNHYTCSGYTTGKAAMLQAFNDATNQVPADLGRLFHGMTDFSVTDGSAEKEIKLIKNTSKVIIKLQDEDATQASPISIGDYSLSITASNGSYHYDNTPVAAQAQLDYIQQYTTLSYDTLQSQGRMLRLTPGDDSRLVIKDRSGAAIPVIDKNNNTVTSPSLVGEIMKNPFINTQSDLDSRDRFELTYKISRNASTGALSVTLINVDDWTVNGGGTGI